MKIQKTLLVIAICFTAILGKTLKAADISSVLYGQTVPANGFVVSGTKDMMETCTASASGQNCVPQMAMDPYGFSFICDVAPGSTFSASVNCSASADQISNLSAE